MFYAVTYTFHEAQSTTLYLKHADYEGLRSSNYGNQETYSQIPMSQIQHANYVTIIWEKEKKSEHSNPWLCRVWWRMYKRSISNTENHICSGKHEPTENFSGNIHRARYQYSYCSEVMNTITLSRAYIISFMNYYHYINCHHYVNYTQLSLQVNCCHNLNNIIRLQLLRFLKGNSATNWNLLI